MLNCWMRFGVRRKKQLLELERDRCEDLLKRFRFQFELPFNSADIRCWLKGSHCYVDVVEVERKNFSIQNKVFPLLGKNVKGEKKGSENVCFRMFILSYASAVSCGCGPKANNKRSFFAAFTSNVSAVEYKSVISPDLIGSRNRQLFNSNWSLSYCCLMTFKVMFIHTILLRSLEIQNNCNAIYF